MQTMLWICVFKQGNDDGKCPCLGWHRQGTSYADEVTDPKYRPKVQRILTQTTVPKFEESWTEEIIKNGLPTYCTSFQEQFPCPCKRFIDPWRSVGQGSSERVDHQQETDSAIVYDDVTHRHTLLWWHERRHLDTSVQSSPRTRQILF